MGVVVEGGVPGEARECVPEFQSRCPNLRQSLYVNKTSGARNHRRQIDTAHVNVIQLWAFLRDSMPES